MSEKVKEMLLLLAVAILAVDTLMVQALMPLNGDVSFLLTMAKNTGLSHFYNEYYEVNPPLIVYIYKVFLMPFYMGILGDISSLRLGVILYLLVGLYLAWLNLSYLNKNMQILLTLSLASGLFLILQISFGQREHLIAAGLVVYLTEVLRSSNSGQYRLLSVVSLLMVAISICLKPQYLLVVIFAELYMVKNNTLFYRWREIATVVIFGGGYLLAVVLFQPEYFNFIVPLARTYYGGYFPDFIDVLMTASAFLLVMLIPYYLLKKRPHYSQLVFVIFLFFIASLGAFIMGRTAFGYHLIPAFTFSFSLAYMAVIIMLKDAVDNFSIKTAVLLLLSVLPIVVFKHEDIRRSYQVDYSTAWHQFVAKEQNLSDEMFVDPDVLNLSQKVDKYTDRGDNIIFLASTNMLPHHTIPVHSGLSWLARQPNFWLLPIAITEPQNSQHRETIRFVQQTITDDINVNKPRVLVVQLRDETVRRYGETQLLNVLLEYPEFVDAINQYKKVESVFVDKSVYQLYLKK
ncbi:hypothetical protein [Vibrio methylphosphonaticus]|uniref:hypothetical protein n=1 Tax=Vibrio methylphosphonaticus TaxID=2946866 RepID=UPI00202A6A5B|nr:hypothetical protein [Vibrio methylphosphonaticus]MCL9774988.1 hypothetical protein [Vibrio methylphosphonaticus]